MLFILSRHAETDYFDHAPFQPWYKLLYWPRPFPAILKVTFWATPLSSHVEIDFFDHTPFQLYWNLLYFTMPDPAMLKLPFWPRPFPTKLKLIFWALPLSSYAETNFIDDAPIKQCWNGLFVLWPFSAMLTNTSLTTPLSSNDETYFFLPPPLLAMLTLTFWSRLFLDMLKLTFLNTLLSPILKLNLLPTPLSCHAKTYFIDHAPYSPSNSVAIGLRSI
jgi:hypothetical protein